MITNNLLILSIIFNIFTLIAIFNLKANLNEATNKKSKGFIDKIASSINAFDVDDLNIDDTKKELKENEIDDFDCAVSYKFKDVYDLMNYVSKHNLDIIDISNKKKRKIKYLDKCVLNNKQSVLMTFEDGTEAIFKPNLYARNNDIAVVDKLQSSYLNI